MIQQGRQSLILTPAEHELPNPQRMHQLPGQIPFFADTFLVGGFSETDHRAIVPSEDRGRNRDGAEGVAENVK